LGAARADDFQDKVDEALALKDDAALVRMLENEAYRGNLKAAFELGRLYREGKHVQKDAEAAIDWFEEAADYNWMRLHFKLGLDEAQLALGQMLLAGEGVPADPETAAEWFEEAAKQGNGEAQIALAEMYLNGTGVEADAGEAWAWARIATDYLSGDDVKRAERICDAAQKQLSGAQLAAAKQEVDAWRPRSL
jgi:TPR repeat protein